MYICTRSPGSTLGSFKNLLAFNQIIMFDIAITFYNIIIVTTSHTNQGIYNI